MLQKIIYCVLYLLCCTVHAENIKTYKVVIPFSAGGASDVLFRFIQPELNQRLSKYQIYLIIENISGAGGGIGLSNIINNDKLTFGFFSPFFAINKNIKNEYSYDYNSVKFLNFAGYNKMIIISGKHSTIAELRDTCSKHKFINFGSSGVGSTSHLTAYYFANKYLNCNEIISVAYKGVSMAYPDLKAGRIDFMADFSMVIDNFLVTNYFNSITEIKDTDITSWHIFVSNYINNADSEIVNKEFQFLKKDIQFTSKLETMFHVYNFSENKNSTWLKNEFDTYKKVIDSLPTSKQ